jgi:hypothetical protein
VQKRVSEPGETHPFPYLQFVVEDRLRELDPTALPPKAPKGGMGMGGGGPGGAGGPGGPGGIDTSNPQVQKLLEQLRQQGKLPPAGAPGMPPMPQGAPPAMPPGAPDESPK